MVRSLFQKEKNCETTKICKSFALEVVNEKHGKGFIAPSQQDDVKLWLLLKNYRREKVTMNNLRIPTTYPFTTGLMWKAAPIIRANAQKKKNAAKPIATS